MSANLLTLNADKLQIQPQTAWKLWTIHSAWR